MALQHISEPMKAALATIEAQIMAQPPSYIAEAGLVVHRITRRAWRPAKARGQLKHLVEDALDCDPGLLAMDIKLIGDLIRAIRDAEQTPPPSEADALVTERQEAA